jgi:hypothetical protein
MSHNHTSITPEITKGAITRQEIAALYNLHPKTIKRKLKAKGVELPKGRIMPEDQQRVFELLGKPIKD